MSTVLVVTTASGVTFEVTGEGAGAAAWVQKEMELLLGQQVSVTRKEGTDAKYRVPMG